ncbi:MAG: PAS domain S-box protein [Armatimonadota bacterium]|nr:PAS domain S-box protein [Armatimonadota bacterium]
MSTADNHSAFPSASLVAPADAPEILERVSDAFLALDNDWRVTYLNEKSAQILGRRREDLMGRVVWDEFPERVDTPFYQVYHDAARTQTPQRLERFSQVYQRWFEVDVYPSPSGLSILFRDATEAREMRLRLEENEQRYRSLFEQNADAVFTFDLEGRFVDANHACEDVSGYSPAELYQTSFLPLVVPEDRERTVAITQRAMRGESQQEEIAIIHKNGRHVDVNITKIPIVVVGQIVGVYGIAKDITVRKQAEAALRESEAQYRALFDSSLDAVLLTSMDGQIYTANPAACRLFGLTEAEFRQRGREGIVDPSDPRLPRLLDERVRTGAARGELRLRRGDGTLFEGEVSSGIFTDRQGQTRTSMILRDITERKAAEDALRETEAWMRAVAEASPVPMTITRWEDSKVIYANHHAYGLFGIAPGEDIIGRRTLEFYAVPSEREALRRALTENDYVPSWDCQLRRADGTLFWTSGAFQRLVYRGEEAIFSVYQDVTARKHLLDEARAEAEQDSLTGLLNHRAFHRRLEDDADRARQTGTSLAIAVLDLDNFKFFNDAYGHGVGDEVLRQVAEVLRTICRAGDSLARFGGDEFALLMPDAGPDTGAAVTARLTSALGDISYRPPGSSSAIPIGLSVGVALFPAEAPTRLAVMQIADERLLRAKTGAANDAEAQQVRVAMRQSIQGFSMLDALVSAVDNKDRYTRRHSEDVIAHSLAIARRLGLDEATQHTAAVAALLHDVGKIGVPDHILRKPGNLTEEEFEAVKMHPSIGAVIVAAVPGLEGTLDAVRHHHERWDGGGYPFGLRGEETPLLARLMAVADAYSAMTTDRPYRKGMEPMEAQRLLTQGAGTQWDPRCVQVFLAAQN